MVEGKLGPLRNKATRGNSGGPWEKTDRPTLKISSETSLDSKSATDFSTAEILVSTGQDAQFLPSVI